MALGHVAGDTVTATVWAKGAAGTTIELFLGNLASNGYTAYDNEITRSVVATGQWQQITATWTMSHADWMWVLLYGDTNSTVPPNTAMSVFDDVLVSSTQRGTILSDGFENGLTMASFNRGVGWFGAGEPVFLVTGGTPGPLEWRKTMVYGFGQLLREDDWMQGTTYNQSDQVGSPNYLTNPSGALVGGAKTLNFGEQLYQWGDQSIRRYTNHERDAD